MGEDLKLFGEVGLGYAQLQKDAEHINKLLNDIDKNAKLLGESFNKNKLDPNTAKTAKELEKMYEDIIKLSGGSDIAEKSTKELAKSIDELAKHLKVSQDEIAKSLKSMSSFDLNTKDFEKQAKDVKKFIDVQRQELTKWAKEKTSLAKELSLRDISKMVNDDYRNASKSGSATEKAEAIKRVKQAMSVLNFTMEQNKAKVKDLQVEYDKLTTTAKALTGETKKVANAQASSIKKQITDITRETNKLETQAGKFDKILNFSGADQSAKSTTKSLGMLLGQAYAIKRAFGYIDKEVMEFERNAVEIQRIAGYTKKEMDDLAQSTFEMGKNMGLNVNTIQEIEGLWARAGRSGQALVDATKTTALGFNVAEFKDAESAVASMNAIINQMYNGDATKAPEILDALTKVADKTAVRNVNDLVEVVSRAGANAKSLGMNLHELNAASSVVMERMKTTGDVLGTQFKTIFAYMADGKRIDKLKKYGVEFTNIGKDGTESLKPFMEMMDNLVAKYKELQSQGKDVMANDMIKNLSGVRNVATLKNLVEGWDSMRERVLLSQNSKGFAERQNAKMMETYAKKVEQLKVSFQELAVALGNNGLLDVLKNIADGTRMGVEAFSKYNKEIMTVIKTVGIFVATIKAVKGVEKIFGDNSLGGMFNMLTGNKLSQINNVRSALSAITGGKVLSTKAEQQMIFEGFDKMGKSAGNAVSPIKMLGASMGGLKAQVVTMTANMSMAVPVIGAVTLALGALLAKMYVDKQKRLNILDDFTSGKANEAIGNIRELKKELDEITGTEAYRRGDANALDAYKSTTEELARLLGVNHSVVVGNKESMQLFNKTLETTIGLKER
ncbi:MAG: phage tail tape measure protein, partial [Peptoniphilus harei]|nr:phage tail tape measure protein [Peptoniphilus harei]